MSIDAAVAKLRESALAAAVNAEASGLAAAALDAMHRRTGQSTAVPLVVFLETHGLLMAEAVRVICKACGATEDQAMDALMRAGRACLRKPMVARKGQRR